MQRLVPHLTSVGQHWLAARFTSGPVKYASLRQPAVTRSLRSFIDKYQPREAWVVNLSLNLVERIGETEVRFVPLHALL